jgi:hypothetical protein
MVESSGRHRVNHEFLDMVDTAGELNACPGGHRFVPVQTRQLVLPGVFGDQKPGLARGSILSADRTQRGSRMIHKEPFNSARDIFTVDCIWLRCKAGLGVFLPGGGTVTMAGFAYL